MDTVLDCLEELNLTKFLNQLNQTEVESVLSSPDLDLTVFSPSNDACDDLTEPTSLSSDEVFKYIADQKIYLPAKRRQSRLVETIAEGHCLRISYSKRNGYGKDRGRGRQDADKVLVNAYVGRSD